MESLTERQVEILELIKENNKIAYLDVAQRLEINNSAVQAHFNTLKEKGIIKKLEVLEGIGKF
ncbi:MULTISPECIES: winged helix-turn-helix domain-containing protein [Flavobacteriaceae]|uniref:winged helix-turn-helix domain-containing protein n=1 Tax=Flavobacteriaceae TaxID=49546 RepID=UPI000307B292|nr:winged helix-turn-helix domain-containing protein [Galbibacter orientalis]